MVCRALFRQAIFGKPRQSWKKLLSDCGMAARVMSFRATSNVWLLVNHTNSKQYKNNCGSEVHRMKGLLLSVVFQQTDFPHFHHGRLSKKGAKFTSANEDLSTSVMTGTVGTAHHVCSCELATHSREPRTMWEVKDDGSTVLPRLLLILRMFAERNSKRTV